MTTFDPGAIVLVHFPFTDLTSSKKRPALVVSPVAFQQKFGDIVLLALTSQDQQDTGLLVSDWRRAGLLKPTWIKPLIGTLFSSLVVKKLGALAAGDHGRVKYTLSILLKADWS